MSSTSRTHGSFAQTEISLSTGGFSEVHDLTPKVQSFINDVGGSGLVSVFVSGSTAAITTMEYEDGCVQDLQDSLERMAPRDDNYEHNKKWGDGNGFSHLRSSLLGPGVTLPFRRGQLQNGTWQQVVLVDNDNRNRDRTVLLTAVSHEGTET